MITEDYVSFEIAKLLKEKGFDEEIETLITPTGKIYFLDENSVEKTPHKTICNSKINTYSNDVSCPTLQMTMKWLREDKGLFIKIDVISEAGCWLSEVLDIHGCTKQWVVPKENQNYEEAVEVAIKYCLEKLI